MLLLIAAVAVVAFVIWTGRGKPVLLRGEWRAGAGLLAIGALVAAALVALRGAWAAGAGLAVVGLGLLFAARSRRGPYRAGRPPASGLTVQEARALLGVSVGASAAEVRAAYARLIAKVHPDKGGTSGLAAQLNAARDRLLEP